jgi:membrane protein involved in colicin uptake
MLEDVDALNSKLQEFQKSLKQEEEELRKKEEEERLRKEEEARQLKAQQKKKEEEARKRKKKEVIISYFLNIILTFSLENKKGRRIGGREGVGTKN